jgi:ribulose-5-phosphate 4-epimerase/fuculose-1-phosphate aldolase
LKYLKDFVKICKDIGRNRMMVAAGGGNISLKLDERQMIIKASGTDLSAVTDAAGHVLVDYPMIGKYISMVSQNSELDDGQYNETIRKSIIGRQNSQPSIETGFHALLGPAVIHTHPILVNAVVCCREGRSILEKIFGEDMLWVPYKPPGLALSIEILKLIKDTKQGSQKTACIFLENHGLIVSGQDLEEYLKSIGAEMYEYEPVSSIEQNKGFSRIVSRFMEDKGNRKYLQGFIFPDAIVYCGCGFAASRKDASKITLHASGLVELPDNMTSSTEKTLETVLTIIHTLLLAKQIGEPKFLLEEEVETVRNMVGEKYRQRIR